MRGGLWARTFLSVLLVLVSVLISSSCLHRSEKIIETLPLGDCGATAFVTYGSDGGAAGSSWYTVKVSHNGMTDGSASVATLAHVTHQSNSNHPKLRWSSSKLIVEFVSASVTGFTNEWYRPEANSTQPCRLQIELRQLGKPHSE